MVPRYPGTRDLLRYGGSLVGIVLAAILFFTTARPLLADFFLISSILGGELLGWALVAIYETFRS